MHTSTSISGHCARTGLLCCAIVVIVVGLVACQSLEKRAPLVDAALVALAGSAEFSDLEQGRRIYITKCAACHVPEPILRYSAERWQRILPPMEEKSKLSEEEIHVLRQYVFAVRKWADTQDKNAP